MSDPRSHRRWRKARAEVLARSEHCALCGLPLDPQAPPRSRWSSSVDHIVPVSRGGDPYEVGNLRAAHLGCNSTRQTGQRTTTTREW